MRLPPKHPKHHQHEIVHSLQVYSRGGTRAQKSIKQIMAYATKRPESFIELVKDVPDEPQIVARSVDGPALPPAVVLASPLPAPPRDQMAFRTYWWGFELYLPAKNVEQLLGANAAAEQILNAIRTFAQGPFVVVQPFLGMLSSYLTMEANLIRQANKEDSGVVVAAVWVVPALFMARTWAP